MEELDYLEERNGPFTEFKAMTARQE